MDIINIEILEDGVISVKTTDISQVNHISADNLLEMLEEELGTLKEKKPIEHAFWKNRVVLKGGKIVQMKQ